jgi:hypothetical protein
MKIFVLIDERNDVEFDKTELDVPLKRTPLLLHIAAGEALLTFAWLPDLSFQIPTVPPNDANVVEFENSVLESAPSNHKMHPGTLRGSKP